MADTRCQLECEDWVRQDWMPQRFGQKFHRDRVRLTSGGVFDFDAVSADGTTIATISTSNAKTSGGKLAVGKLMKVRSDMLFLLLAAPRRAAVILTERDMYELCEKEKEADVHRGTSSSITRRCRRISLRSSKPPGRSPPMKSRHGAKRAEWRRTEDLDRMAFAGSSAGADDPTARSTTGRGSGWTWCPTSRGGDVE